MRIVAGRGGLASIAGWLLLGLGLSPLSGCASTATFSGGVFRQGALAYRVGPLPATWQRIRSQGANLAFRHDQGGTIVVSGQCPAQDDAPLSVLTNHLLFGLSARRETSRETQTLDGREALRTQVSGQLDGVHVALDLVVLKKDGCLYDLQLISGPDHFAARQPDFTAFLAGFGTLSGH